MTSLFLLLAAAPQGEPAVAMPSISKEEAIAKAKAKAAQFGVKTYGEPMADQLRRNDGVVWHIRFSPALSRPTSTMDLAANDGRLVGFSDPESMDAPALPGWTPRIARPSARSRTIAYGRQLGVPSDWKVGRTSFDGTGKNRWPARAEVLFEERPLGYRYLVDGNRATLKLNPRTGAMVEYRRFDGFAVDAATPRLRSDQAASIARKWRAENRTDLRPRVEGPVRLGWAVVEPGSRVARLVYDVPFLVETHWVDANNGRVLGGRRTKDVRPL